jgi:hypothetical protein
MGRSWPVVGVGKERVAEPAESPTSAGLSRKTEAGISRRVKRRSETYGNERAAPVKRMRVGTAADKPR